MVAIETAAVPDERPPGAIDIDATQPFEEVVDEPLDRATEYLEHPGEAGSREGPRALTWSACMTPRALCGNTASRDSV